MWSIHWVLAWPQGPGRCYADILLTEATHLSDVQLEQSLWEPIVASAHTTLVTTEWIMFELARNPAIQERVYKEVVDVTGGHGYEKTRMVTEDDIPSMPYLSAVIKETLRKYPPLPLLQSRYVEKDTTLGGYDIPKGWQVGDTLQNFKFQKIPVQSSKCNVRCKTSR
jgi:ent-kaurene oxidase